MTALSFARLIIWKYSCSSSGSCSLKAKKLKKMFHIKTSSKEPVTPGSLTLQEFLIDLIGFGIPDLQEEVGSPVVLLHLLCKLNKDRAIFHLLIEVAGRVQLIKFYTGINRLKVSYTEGQPRRCNPSGIG